MYMKKRDAVAVDFMNVVAITVIVLALVDLMTVLFVLECYYCLGLILHTQLFCISIIPNTPLVRPLFDLVPHTTCSMVGKYRVLRKNCVFSQFTATPP